MIAWCAGHPFEPMSMHHVEGPPDACMFARLVNSTAPSANVILSPTTDTETGLGAK